ncbi:MAG TPA: hypothetical protein VEB22_15330 [Phycisphaerales bacterium]|nr:hypothetical protein [Phycisphaerales bacterium]
MTPRPPCAWCRGPIPDRARRDSVCCSQRCRQARHRFGRERVELERASHPLRVAYADPPYPGLARRYYADHPDFAGEVDHAELVSRLQAYDGWALSTSAEALPAVLRLCPGHVAIAAWVRGARHVRSHKPLSSWEPVIYVAARGRGSRDASLLERGNGSRTDALVHVSRPRLTDPQRVVGAKPAAFCWWLFSLLGALPGDTFDDLFPGSGGVSRAWALLSSRASGDASHAGGTDASPAARADSSPSPRGHVSEDLERRVASSSGRRLASLEATCRAEQLSTERS